MGISVRPRAEQSAVTPLFPLEHEQPAGHAVTKLTEAHRPRARKGSRQQVAMLCGYSVLESIWIEIQSNSKTCGNSKQNPDFFLFKDIKHMTEKG